jgi:hypothetical protein
MLPIILLIPLLQPLAPAHVSECHHEEAHRHQNEHNVLHTRNLRQNAAADFLRV